MKFTNYTKMNVIGFLRNLMFIGAVFIPFYQAWGGLNYGQIFLLQAWFMTWLFILDIPTGAISDIIGRKKVIMLSGVANGVAALVYASQPSFLIFMLAEFLWAAAAALLSGADKAIIYDTLKEEDIEHTAKEKFSRYSAVSTAGIVIGLPLGSIVANLSILPFPAELRIPMLLTALPLFISVIIAATLKEPKIRKRGRRAFLSVIRNSFRFLKQTREVQVLSFDLISISITTFFMFWFYQSLLQIFNVNLGLFGFVAAAFNIIGVFLLLRVKSIEKLVGGKKRLLFYSAVIPGVAYLVLGLWLNLVVALIAIFTIISLRLLRKPLFDTYINAYVPSKDRTTILSTVSAIERFGMIIAYLLLGPLSDWSLTYTFAILGIITLILAFSSRVEEDMLRQKSGARV